MEGATCRLFTDCTNCISYGRNIFYQLQLIKGYNFQQYRLKQSEVLFLQRGQVRVSGLHFPDTLVSGGQILVLPESVEMDIVILEDVDCLVYASGGADFLCEEQHRIIAELKPLEVVWNTLNIIPPLKNFVDGIRMSLENGVFCRLFWTIKEKELMFLMNCYYSHPELLIFLTPALNSLNRFKTFVQRNYYKVRTVEELALLGGYGVITFRRLFKEEYGEPAYRWMNRQKQEHILYDLTYRNLSISEIANKYQFESLSQFSNFCKKYLGGSPREIIKKKAEDVKNRALLKI